MMPFSPAVSVIIPAYNCSGTIAGTLEALLAQTYPGVIEIIVVDDGSLDSTRDVIKGFQGVKYLYQANAGPASARNLGAKNASGEVLFFTDSDCVPEKGWIEKMLSGFEATDIAVVAGSYGIANPQDALACIIQQEIFFRHTYLMPEFPQAFGSYNFSIRRSVFETLGGFNTDYRRASGEDNDLSYKILAAGLRIRFMKDAVVLHYHQNSFKKYLKEQFRHGFWRVKMYIDHPRMAKGDDYTFWKDIVEVPLAGGAALSLIWPGPKMFLGLAGFFLIFEIIAGFSIMRSKGLGLGAGMVFFFRAFARAAGFFIGAVSFIKYFLFRHKKI
ncbi:MAG: glycosyltransferase [Candidatus Omnitrophica bacterium]|nr:glycosyltransferase [Candidatus Omnitrophota bacterium]